MQYHIEIRKKQRGKAQSLREFAVPSAKTGYAGVAVSDGSYTTLFFFRAWSLSGNLYVTFHH